MKKTDKKIKRILSVLLCAAQLVALCAVLAVPSSALDDPDIANCQSAYLYNFENDKAIYQLNSTEKVYPTSTVKMMTGILAIEALGGDMTRVITVTSDMLAGSSGQNIGLDPGETVTVGDMIWTLLVNGANDSAYVLASAVSGSVSEFVTLMNKRAKELGAYNTYYTNPTGMHDSNMYTTAEDTAIIARHAHSLDSFMECASSVKYSMPQTNLNSARTVYNRNCLLTVYYDKNYYYAEAKGMNAGSTSEGGYCCVTTAVNGELTYLAVVMGAKKVDEKIYSYVNAQKMLEWAFSAYKYVEIMSPDKTVCEIPVTLSTAVDYVTLVASDTLNVYLPADVDVDSEITVSWVTYSEELQAPVTEKQVAGSVSAVYNGSVLGTADLIATADVSRNDVLYGMYRIRQFTKSRFFIATVIAAVVFTLIYIFGTAYLKGKRGNRGMKF